MEDNADMALQTRMRQAVDELKEAILSRYPDARFQIAPSPDDPRSVHILTRVNLEDPDEVGDLVLDRLIDLQLEHGLPIHVIPLRSEERIEAMLTAESVPGSSRTSRSVRSMSSTPTSVA